MIIHETDGNKPVPPHPVTTRLAAKGQFKYMYLSQRRPVAENTLI